MAFKEYTKEAEYILPWGYWSFDAVDGIYIDNHFFDNNIPIRGMNVVTYVKPSGDRMMPRTLSSFMYGWNGSSVIAVKIFEHTWSYGAVNGVSQYANLDDSFYGIGLNILDVRVQVGGGATGDSIYSVQYVLGVSY